MYQYTLYLLCVLWMVSQCAASDAVSCDYGLPIPPCQCLTPINPHGIIGESLWMTCRNPTDNHSLSGGEGSLASMLHFTVRGRAVPDIYTLEVDNNTRVMFYPVREEDDRADICCKTTKNGAVDIESRCQCVVLRVMNRPSIHSVTVYNWEELRFDWSRKGNKTNLCTTISYTGWWKNSSEAVYHRCENSSQTAASCKLPVTNHANVSDAYVIKVDATYKKNGNKTVKASSEEVKVNQTWDVVEPAQPDNVQVTHRTASTLQLSWHSPRPGQAILYNITYHCRWQETQITTLAATVEEDLNLELSELAGDTTYNVCILCRSARGGWWSRHTCLDATTNIGIPAVAPPVTKTGYELLESDDMWTRAVRLYWQPVPVHQRNGNITQHRVTYEDSSGENVSVTADPRDQWVDICDLQADSTYHFYIEARTKIGGYGETFNQPITVLAAKLVPDIASNFTVIALNKSTVNVSWNPSEDHLTSVTVFWCLQDHNHQPCQEKLSWEELPASQTSLTLEKNSTYMFGISVQTVDGNSGITWATCVHDITQVSDSPSATVEKVTSDTVWVSLVQPSCTKARGFIYLYRFYVCAVQSSQCAVMEFPSSESDSSLHSLQGLQPDTKYHIGVASVTAAGVSPSNSLEVETTVGGLNQVQLGIIIAASVVCAVFLLVGLIKCAWLLCKCRNLVKEPVKCPATLADPIPNGYAGSYAKAEFYLQSARNRAESPVGRVSPFCADEQAGAGMYVSTTIRHDLEGDNDPVTPTVHLPRPSTLPSTPLLPLPVDAVCTILPPEGGDSHNPATSLCNQSPVSDLPVLPKVCLEPGMYGSGLSNSCQDWMPPADYSPEGNNVHPCVLEESVDYNVSTSRDSTGDSESILSDSYNVVKVVDLPAPAGDAKKLLFRDAIADNIIMAAVEASDGSAEKVKTSENSSIESYSAVAIRKNGSLQSQVDVAED